MITIALFNNKGGVGKTSLAYHLAWMFADLGVSVIAADLDPQANLTSMFLDEDRLIEVWPDGPHPYSVLGVVAPILRGTGDIANVHVEPVSDNIGLIVGDLGLSVFEDRLSSAWPQCVDGDEAAFRAVSAFHRMLTQAARVRNASLVVVDVGPNLGAINRATLIAADHVVIPMAPDLFSLQGLRNLGPTLRGWRGSWRDRLARGPDPELDLPSGTMDPLGYVVLQHAVRLDRPARAYGRWMDRIPGEYRRSVLAEFTPDVPTVADDPHCLAMIKHYRSLMPLAMEARKPMFALRPADGAIGAHMAAVQECYSDFQSLAVRIAERAGLSGVSTYGPNRHPPRHTAVEAAR
ncbi:MAG: ParA family protein [Anaerolineae bacterium]